MSTDLMMSLWQAWHDRYGDGVFAGASKKSTNFCMEMIA